MKLFDFYTIKEKALWLQQNYDDVHNEIIDNSPKLSFVFAIDWWIGYQRPRGSYSRFAVDKIEEKKDHYSSLNIRIYLLFWQIHSTIRLHKLPYTTKSEYLQWRRSEKSK